MSGVMNVLKSYIQSRYPGTNTDNIGDPDPEVKVDDSQQAAVPSNETTEPSKPADNAVDEEEDEQRKLEREEEERERVERERLEREMEEEERYYRQCHDMYMRYERELMEKEQAKVNKRNELAKRLKGQAQNNNHGFGYQVCDMERLKRFLVLGSEFNTYYVSAKALLIENIQCVNKLIAADKYQAVLDLVEQYNKEGRVAKDEPLITVLAICALHQRAEVRRAAYEKVNSVCNIPTKLFHFIDITHTEIVRRRIANPPEPQPYASKKRKIAAAEAEIAALKISDDGKLEQVEEMSREPSENVDDTQQSPTEPPKKKKKKKKANKEFKKVNVESTKSLGWGRMRRTGVANFYSDPGKDPCRLLYLLTKYKSRHNWDHKQVMQYSHPKMSGEGREAKNLVLKYFSRGMAQVKEEMDKMASKPGLCEKMSEAIGYIQALDAVKNLKPETEGDEEKLIGYLETYGQRTQEKTFTSQLSLEGASTTPNTQGKKSPIQIVREHIPTGFLNSAKVWELMLKDMPMTAMIRNLGKMSSLGLFSDNKNNVDIVLRALGNEKRIQSARVHPIKLLIAAETYQTGRGLKGSLNWPVNSDIIAGLNSAFYKSFKSPELNKTFRTGLKYLLALDVSGSMQGARCLGCETLTPALATAAMAMVTWHIEEEENCDIMGFGGEFQNLKGIINRNMTVQEAMRAIGMLNFGATDCSLPMIYALTERKEFDVFIVYTDSETDTDVWQPMDALRLYNIEMKRDAKLIVMGMSSAGFTIADPKCPNALDVVGFDANVPEMINNFVTGNKNMKCDVCEDCTKQQ